MSRSSCAEAPRADRTGRRLAAGRLAGWRGLAALLVLVLVLAGHALGLFLLTPLQRLDLALYDGLLAALAPTRPDPRIAIVDIDERALASHGRWPWRRTLLAELIERIGHDQGARLIALDMVLAEPDAGPDADALVRLLDGPLRDHPQAAAALRGLQPQLDDDARLAATLQRWPVTLGIMLGSPPPGRPGTPGAALAAVSAEAAPGAAIGDRPLPPAALTERALGPRLYELPVWSDHSANLPALQRAARGAGHLNGVVDADGVVRRVPLLARREGRVLGSLALVVAQQWLAAPAPGSDGPPVRGTTGLAALTPRPDARAPAWEPLSALHIAGPAGSLQVPVDRHGLVLVPYRRDGGFARVSAADVLSGRLPPGALRNRIVLVGLGAAGLIDQRLTPLAGALPGADLHASLMAGLLDGEVRAVPAWAGVLQAALLLPTAVLVPWVLRRRGLLAGGLVATGLMLAALAGAALAWTAWHAWVAPGVLLVLPPLLVAAHLALSYRAISGARRQLTELFGQYVPPELVAQMSRRPERHTLSSRRAELTVMFADVRDFTRIAQQLPPEQLSASMNLLLSHLTDIVREHHGTLDKYIGDAVMAFWGRRWTTRPTPAMRWTPDWPCWPGCRCCVPNWRRWAGPT